MSSEEIVTRIQAGDSLAMGELWEAVSRFVQWMANRVILKLGEQSVVQADDLINAGYIAMTKAVKGYKRECGAFTTWLSKYLQNEFNSAMGFRNASDRAYNNALRLQAVLYTDADGEEMTLEDAIADRKTAWTEEAMEERAYREQLRSACRDVLNAIPPQFGDILRDRYLSGKSMEAIAEESGLSVSAVQARERQALRRVRSSSKTQGLLSFYCFDYYNGVGFGSFENSGMSIQERYLINLEKLEAMEQEKRLKNAQKMDELNYC